MRGNRATARNVNPDGLTVAFAGGIDADGPLLLERSMVVENIVKTRTLIAANKPDQCFGC